MVELVLTCSDACSNRQRGLCTPQGARAAGARGRTLQLLHTSVVVIKGGTVDVPSSEQKRHTDRLHVFFCGRSLFCDSWIQHDTTLKQFKEGRPQLLQGMQFGI